MKAPEHKLKSLKVRAKLPAYFRLISLVLLGVTILAVGLGFYTSRGRSVFKLKSEHARLSNEIVAEVSGYERLETDGDIRKYFIKADKATTFADNHQELENVFLQVYDAEGVNFDEITAAKALYIPEENKNFTAYLAGNVNIQTRDRLNVKTEHITYTRSSETAESEDAIEFARDNVRGKAFGALVKVAEKRLELLGGVEIDAFNAGGDVREGRIKSSTASFDQASQTIEFRDNVVANVERGSRVIDVSAGRASVLFTDGNENPAVSKLQLYDTVNIRSAESGAKPTRINSDYALYDKNADRFELRGASRIETIEGEQSTNITARDIDYDQGRGLVDLTGGAEIIQTANYLRGDVMNAQLNPGRKLKNAVVRGNAYLKQTMPDRTSEVSAPELNATFADDQNLTAANSVGQSTAVLTPSNNAEYTLVKLEAPRAVHLWFKGAGLIDRMQTDGRTTISLNASGNSADAANKRITADSVRTFFDGNGKDLNKAEAIGDAELFVEPLKAGPENYKTTVNAPRFDCDFFPGNNARACVGAVKARAVRVPTVAIEGRGTQNISADRLTASFNAQTKDVERLDATGSAKFSEADRNALADQFTYTTADGVVRLRGGEPTAWDARARAKAGEIDWNIREQRSYLRGKVSTTYYNQRQTGGATPFADSEGPVYVTANSADFDHKRSTGTYTGNARAWQENNYVRANSFAIDQNAGTFVADGVVQSVLYNASRKENDKEINVPVFASSQRMTYGRDQRHIRYENTVDIRQGSDRMTGAIADIFLNEQNGVNRSVVQNQVVITQPKRRATGDYAEYTAADETVLLRGRPATVDDAENGSSSGGEVRVYMRENRVVGEGKPNKATAGRIRSVYKVKNPQ